MMIVLLSLLIVVGWLTAGIVVTLLLMRLSDWFDQEAPLILLFPVLLWPGFVLLGAGVFLGRFIQWLDERLN